MYPNNNQLRSNEENLLVIIIEDNKDHFEYLRDNINKIYKSFRVNPKILWFQDFDNCLEYLNSDENKGKEILSIWVDLFLGKYSHGRKPEDLLSELYASVYDRTINIFPISSLIDASPEYPNFTKKDNISEDNHSLLEQLKTTISSNDYVEISKEELKGIYSLLYGKNLEPGLVDQVREINSKLDQLEVDVFFQYSKLEKLVLEIKAGTWILWALVKVSKKLLLSKEIIIMLITFLFGGGVAYIITILLDLIE